MFRSLRLRLTIWFLLLTVIVYSAAAVGGYYLFRAQLTSMLDEELNALASEIVPSINVGGPNPTLEEWAKTARHEPFKFLPTIQLFTASGDLFEEYGPIGIAQLYTKEKEVVQEDYSFRVLSTPLLHGKKTVGYLQLQLSTRSRKRATDQLAETMIFGAPFLLIGLAIAGYLFSGTAAKPIEVSFEVLRRFMSDAGHELSTPIAIIQVNAESLEDELPENNHELTSNITPKLDVIKRSTERMSNLVNDLMLLSRMESPRMVFNKVPLQLDSLVKDVTDEFRELFKTKNIQLIADDLKPCPVIADSDSFKRVLVNLLQNAFRYTDQGAITVSTEPFGRLAKLTVSDTGIGIPKDSVPRIFDRFYRVDKARTRVAGGSGLGLSIVKAIVELHKGKVEVQSEEGKGTTFTILLPLRT